MIQVGYREIGVGRACFVVAEAGLAHEGSCELAKRLIDLAVDGGADAVKFQVYKTEELIDPGRDPERFERFKRKELGYGDFEGLKGYAESKGIIWFASAHTIKGFEFLRDIRVPIYKVGSGEGEFSPILRMAVESGKLAFVSTGLRRDEEVRDLVRRWGGPNVVFLHCVTMYPVMEDRANLGFMNRLGYWCKLWGSQVGYSDHLSGTLGLEVAVGMGARVIEKHVRLPESTGQDVLCSVDGEEFKTLVEKIRRIEKMLGSDQREYSEEERRNEKWAMKGRDGLRPLY